jgi:hypothetical protein
MTSIKFFCVTENTPEKSQDWWTRKKLTYSNGKYPKHHTHTPTTESPTRPETMDALPIDMQSLIWKTFYTNHVMEEFQLITRSKFHNFNSHLPISVRYNWMKKTYCDDIIYCEDKYK